jgi:hypothetical protein
LKREKNYVKLKWMFECNFWIWISICEKYGRVFLLLTKQIKLNGKFLVKFPICRLSDPVLASINQLCISHPVAKDACYIVMLIGEVQQQWLLKLQNNLSISIMLVLYKLIMHSCQESTKKPQTQKSVCCVVSTMYPQLGP